jgi:hypothetical protein
MGHDNGLDLRCGGEAVMGMRAEENKVSSPPSLYIV